MAHLITPKNKIYSSGKACCMAGSNRSEFELSPEGDATASQGYFSTMTIDGDKVTLSTPWGWSREGYIGLHVCCGTQVRFRLQPIGDFSYFDWWEILIYHDDGSGMFSLVEVLDMDSEELGNSREYTHSATPGACGHRYKVEVEFHWITVGQGPNPDLGGFELTVEAE